MSFFIVRGEACMQWTRVHVCCKRCQDIWHALHNFRVQRTFEFFNRSDTVETMVIILQSQSVAHHVMAWCMKHFCSRRYRNPLPRPDVTAHLGQILHNSLSKLRIAPDSNFYDSASRRHAISLRRLCCRQMVVPCSFQNQCPGCNLRRFSKLEALT